MFLSQEPNNGAELILQRLCDQPDEFRNLYRILVSD